MSAKETRLKTGLVITHIYFVIVVIPCILLMLIGFWGFISNASFIFANGALRSNTSFLIFSVALFLLSPTFLNRTLRHMYYLFPWLFPLVFCLLLNTLFWEIGLKILNEGYKINVASRHVGYTLLFVVQIVICRLLLSLFCHFKKIQPPN